MKALFHFFYIFFITVWSTLTFANDSFGPIAVGGISLQKTDDIALVKEVLDISYKKISVYYEFLNEGTKDITTKIFFPLPKYSGLVIEDKFDLELHPFDFEVLVDNKSLPFITHVDITDKNGKNINDVMISLGLDLQKLATLRQSMRDIRGDYRAENLGFFTTKQIQKLRELNLLYDSGCGNYTDPETKERKGDEWANWFINVSYEWEYTFKPGQVVRVQHQYEPIIYNDVGGYNEATGKSLGTEYCNAIDPLYNISSYTLESLKEPHCISKYTIDKLVSICKKRDSSREYDYDDGDWHKYLILKTNVEYILTTANSWKDGIRDFTLRIDKIHPEAFVSLCFPGKFKKINNTILESHIKNFKPAQNLDIRFDNIKF